MAGNERLFKELLFDFYKDYVAVASTLREAADKGAYEEVEGIAHTIKGIAANIGAENLRKASGELERADKEHNPAAFASLLNTFEAAMKEVIASIRSLQQKTEHVSPLPETIHKEVADMAEIRPLFSKLESLLRQGNAEAEECWSGLEKKLAGTVPNEKIVQFQEQIENYDSKGAEKSLVEIKKYIRVKEH